MTTLSETAGFPVYGAAYDPDRKLVYVVGGGGSSKSGVKNLIVAYNLAIEDNGIKVKKVGQTETGNGAPMNISIHNSLILCGVNDRCWMLETDIDDDIVSLNLLKSFQTVDPASPEDDPYQKVVKFAPDGSLFATSGSEGNIKLWKEGKKLFEIDSGEVADLSFAPGSRRLYYATSTSLISYDLEQKSGREIEKTTNEFQFRCVLSLRSMLVAVENSNDRSKSRMIFRDAEGKSSRLALPVKKAVTSIAVDHEESLLAFGCADGTVGLLILSSKKVVYLKQGLHSFAVTSVQVATQKDEYLLISGSPDGNLKITRGHIGGSSSIAIVLLFVLAILAVFIAYMLQNDPEFINELIFKANTLLKL